MTISGDYAILSYAQIGGAGFELALIDLVSAKVVKLPGSRGRPSPKTAAILNGKLVMGSADPGYLIETDGITTREIGQCGDRDYYCAATAPDGRLFLGTFSKGTLEIYDPATGKLTRIGEFDQEITAPQYVYTLATDGRYAYAGMGQSPWYLAIFDTQTGTAEQFFRDDNLPNVNVTQSADGSGNIYFGAYQLLDGRPVPVASKPAQKPPYIPNNLNIETTTLDTSWLALNLDAAQASSAAAPTVRWSLNGGAQQSVSISGIATAPAQLNRAISVGKRLLVVTGAYGPVLWYTPSTKTFEEVGWPQRSLYDALAVGTDIYLSGYPAVTFRWDTIKPWTLTASSTDLTATNPRQVAAWGKYHYFQAVDSSGLIWVAANHERDSVGGELGWYNPTTEAKGSLRDDFTRWTPRALCAVGNRIVYSGNSLDADTGQVFMVDTTTKSVVQTWTPVAGTTDAGVIIAVSATDLVGITGAKAYRMNVETGAIIWSVTLPAAAFGMASYDRRIATAPDGWLWFAIQNAIYKLNPANGAVVKVVELDAPYNVCFHKGAAYFYLGTRIRKLL